MTEPSNAPVPEADAVVQWPADTTPTGDALVDRALGLLADVAGSPVSGHGELYAGIHDSLLEALDAEPGLPSAPSNNRPEGDS